MSSRIFIWNEVQDFKSDWLLAEILFSYLRLKIMLHLVKLIPFILPVQHWQRKSQSKLQF